MTLKSYLSETPFTLALSSGFFGFFAHCGVLLALSEAKIRPSKITGSSAGAILAAAWSHGVPESEIKSLLLELKKKDIWDPRPGLGFLRGKKVEGLMSEILEHRSQKLPYSISLFDIFARQTKSFSTGGVPRLVRASVAVPLMFHPVWIRGRCYWDGGIGDKAALHGTAKDERVFVHYLESQGAISVYERSAAMKTLQSELNEQRSALILKNLGSIGPNSLSRGTDVVGLAFEKTLDALKKEFQPILSI
jgi:NTE family protein